MKQIVSCLTDGNDGNKHDAEFGNHPWFGQAFYMAADAPVNFSRPLVLLPEKTMSIEFHRKLVWRTCILLIFIILNLPWVKLNTSLEYIYILLILNPIGSMYATEVTFIINLSPMLVYIYIHQHHGSVMGISSSNTSWTPSQGSERS